MKNSTDRDRTLKTFNILRNIPEDLPDELIEEILRSDSVRIERIVSRGHRSDDDFWYDQAENEWVLVISGAAKIAFADTPGEIELEPGDYLQIPAGRQHRVTWTAAGIDTIWLAIFYT